jgi:hypothetical protein
MKVSEISTLELIHPSIFEDLGCIPTTEALPRWIEVFEANGDTKKAAIRALETGGDWEAIRKAIAPHATAYGGERSELYRQVTFRALGTQEKIISGESIRLLSEYAASLILFLTSHGFPPGQEEAILDIFECAGWSESRFKAWKKLHLNIQFCEQILPYPASPGMSIDRVYKTCKPLIGKSPITQLPKRFGGEGAAKLLKLGAVYSQRFRLYDNWQKIDRMVWERIDPTGAKFVSLPLFRKLLSNKRIETKAAKLITAVDIKQQSSILAQCFYCFELRNESANQPNGIVPRSCPKCKGQESKFERLMKV